MAHLLGSSQPTSPARWGLPEEWVAQPSAVPPSFASYPNLLRVHSTPLSRQLAKMFWAKIHQLLVHSTNKCPPAGLCPDDHSWKSQQMNVFSILSDQFLFFQTVFLFLQLEKTMTVTDSYFLRIFLFFVKNCEQFSVVFLNSIINTALIYRKSIMWDSGPYLISSDVSRHLLTSFGFHKNLIKFLNLL